MTAPNLPIRRRGLTVGFCALAFAVASVVIFPATALAEHLEDSTKTCVTAGGEVQCRLTIDIDTPQDGVETPLQPNDVITVDVTGATFTSAQLGAGSTCPSVPGNTDLTVNPNRLAIDPGHPQDIDDCVIVVEETLQPTGGQICQTIDFQGSTAETICVTPAPCTNSPGVISRPNAQGGQDIYGTSGNDVICGTSGNDRIYGGGGNDTIYGFGGDDQIDAGPGTDTVHAGTGNDACVNAEHTTGCERSV